MTANVTASSTADSLVLSILSKVSTVQKRLHGLSPDRHSIVFQNFTLNNADVTEYWRSVRNFLFWYFDLTYET